MKQVIQQFRSALLGKGRGFSSSVLSKYDYGRLIRQKEEEIIALVHAYNKNKSNDHKAKGIASSGRSDPRMRVADFRQILLGFSYILCK